MEEETQEEAMESAAAEEPTMDEGTEAHAEEESAAEATDGIPPVDPSLEVITAPSGLKYIDIVVGDGASPEPGDRVQVHYTGWLADGTKFDSSVDRGQPFTFPLGEGRVIRGWDEGVATMKVGGKRRLIIPSDLAYGPQGRPPVIPPAAELTFDVQLLGVQ
ncbi:MAG: FKBP-type peptidyl-prolyl cis-trans isomerase [Candidatus Eisenbacteria bacterium]|nr:FKBP-type peptidyl-prolyl cis-trans isomerase [Candidatus Latescibacterota bacterium]MBD3302009.1 FKBP-type peptidyl-prolyl cis-trans isomerase [Candidatus Eisenbacteria bacterium]